MFIATGSTLVTKLTGEMVIELNTQVAGLRMPAWPFWASSISINWLWEVSLGSALRWSCYDTCEERCLHAASPSFFFQDCFRVEKLSSQTTGTSMSLNPNPRGLVLAAISITRVSSWAHGMYGDLEKGNKIGSINIMISFKISCLKGQFDRKKKSENFALHRSLWITQEYSNMI